MLQSTSPTGSESPQGLNGPGTKLVVIGGDAAGMSAASQARRDKPELEIVAFERGWHTSYAA